MPILPEPDCKLGYTEHQIEQIMGSRVADFYEWMHGQTGAICMPSNGDPCERSHGFVFYRGDINRFLNKLSVVD